jgi:hypothetical protein
MDEMADRDDLTPEQLAELQEILQNTIFEHFPDSDRIELDLEVVHAPDESKVLEKTLSKEEKRRELMIKRLRERFKHD